MNPITPRFLADIASGMLFYFFPRIVLALAAATFVSAGLWTFTMEVVSAFTG